MEVSHFCPPADARFNIGTTEQKMPSSHEELSRRTKHFRGHRLFNKTCPLKFIRATRETLQRSVASRSSALRQGKLAEVRAGLDSNEFDAVQAAARKASSCPVTTRTMKETKAGKRHKKIDVSTTFQHEIFYFTDVAGNTNIPVANDSNMLWISGHLANCTRQIYVLGNLQAVIGCHIWSWLWCSRTLFKLHKIMIFPRI